VFLKATALSVCPS